MTFSEFVKMLYRFIGGDTNRIDFMVELTTEIMKKSFTDKKHPFLSKSPDMMGRIFNGTKGLPQKDAKIILFNLDRERFVEYLVELPLNVTTSIGKAMREKGLTVSDDEIIDVCTDLFISILEERVKVNETSTTKAAIKKTSTPNTKNKKAFQARTPSEQMLETFEQLISKYKIAYFICSELTYSQKVDEFVETVKIELLAEFVNEQEDDVYNKISKFNETLYGFNISLDDLNPSTARQFHLYTNFLRTLDVTLCEILTQITEDRDRLSMRLGEGIQRGQNLDEEIKQLAVMESLLNLYSQLDTLYSTICNGKTLLVF